MEIGYETATVRDIIGRTDLAPVGAQMAKRDPPDVAFATEFRANPCLRGVYGLVKRGDTPVTS